MFLNVLKWIYSITGGPTYPLLSLIIAIVVGGVIGGLFWGYIAHEYNKEERLQIAFSNSTITPNNKNVEEDMQKPPTSINVTSHGQQGGITAGVIINNGTQPRRLNTEQKRKLTDLLKAVPRGKIGFNINPNVPDAEAFANDIAEVMVKDGFQVERIDRIMSIGGTTLMGLTVGINAQPDSPVATMVIDAFNSIGVSAKKGSGGGGLRTVPAPGMIYFDIGQQ